MERIITTLKNIGVYDDLMTQKHQPRGRVHISLCEFSTVETKKDKKWVHMLQWVMVSLVDRDFKYSLHIEPALASAATAAEMAQLLTKVLAQIRSSLRFFFHELL